MQVELISIRWQFQNFFDKG